jgi:uncharacterized membrane protein YdjX (TVP38/TMEM64 family)
MAYTAVMPIFCSSFVTYWLINNSHYLENISIYGLIAIGILSIFAMAFALLPTTFVATVSGFLGGWQFLPFLIIGYGLATLIGSWLSTKIDGGKILQIINRNPKSKQIVEKLQNDEFKIIAFARLSPLFPFAVSNVIFSFLKVKIKNLLIAGTIGMLPRTILVTFLGTKAKAIAELLMTKTQFGLSEALLTVLLIVSIVGLYYFIKKAISK